MNKESMVHANRIRLKDMTREKIETLVATDLDEVYVEKIIKHSGTGKNSEK